MEVIQTPKEYREERFEYALYINEFVICKRNFRIDNFIEDSMSTINFKNTVDSIVRMIDEDLKSKTRIYTWYYWDENKDLYYVDNSLEEQLAEPWESTFKFVITDNKREVFSKIWDGRYYPRAVRDKVDLSNKIVTITNKDGRVYTFDKETYFTENKDRLTSEMYILKAMMYDKPNLLAMITKKICESCSFRNGEFKSIKDYITEDTYETKDFQRDSQGNAINTDLSQLINTGETKIYQFNIKKANNKWMYSCGKTISDKNKKK